MRVLTSCIFACTLFGVISHLAAQTSGQNPGALPNPAASAAYETQLRAARDLSKKDSWDLARDAYAKAVLLAPDAEARRWCQFWRLDATWRAVDRYEVDHSKQALSGLCTLLTGYTSPASRDAFWAAVTENIAELKNEYIQDFREARVSPWLEYLAVADYLAAQPATPEATGRYAAFVLRILPKCEDRKLGSINDRVIDHLERASRLAADATQRAELASFAAAHSSELSPTSERSVRLFAHALHTAQGTSLEALTRAEEFTWRAEAGRLVPDKEGRPDIPTWLQEIESHLSRLTADQDVITITPKDGGLSWLKSWWGSPYVVVNPASLYRPEEPLCFTVGCAYSPQLIFEIHRIGPTDWPRLGWRNRSQSYLPEFTPDLVTTWTADFSEKASHLWQSRIETVPAALPSGLYALVVRDAAKSHLFVPFTVSAATASALQTGKNDWEFFCYDNKSSTPLSGKKIEAWILAEGALVNGKPFTGTTDQHGRLVIHFPGKTIPSFWSAILRLESGDPIFLDYLKSDLAPDESLHAEIFLPREFYRPGETVPWKLIGRHRRNHRFEKASGSLTLKAIGSADIPLGESAVFTWDDAGTASGEFVIPAQTRPGFFQFSLHEGDKKVGRGDFFWVDNFAPQSARARLELASQSSYLHAGGTATFRVHASYSSGDPVINAPVEFHFNAHALKSAVRNSPAYEAWDLSLREKNFHAVTDANGVATYSLDMPDAMPDLVNLSVSYDVKPSGISVLSQSKILTLTPSGLHLDGIRDATPKIMRPGEAFTARFRYLDAFDKPAPVTGKVSLVESSWEEVWLDPNGNAVTGPALVAARRAHQVPRSANLPDGWKKIQARYDFRPVATIVPSSVDADGWATATFTLPHAGRFHLEFESHNGPVYPLEEFWFAPREDYSLPPALVYAIDETTRTLPLAPWFRQIVPPTEIISGDKPRFLVIAPESATHGVITLSGETETRTQAFETSGQITSITFEEPPPLSTRASARLVFPAELGGQSLLVGFPVRHLEQQITTEIVTAADNSRPGNPTDVMVRTRIGDKPLASARIAFAVADESVNQIYPSNREAASKFLKYSVVADRPIVTGTLWQKHVPATCFKDPRPGMSFYKSENDGDKGEVLEITSSDENSSEKYHRKHATISSMPMIRAVMNSSPTFSIEDMTLGPPDVVRSPLSADNAPDNAASTPRIRRFFSSTAFWAPSLKTDTKGEARIHFTYPDNLIQWRLTAYALGDDGNTFGTAVNFTQTSLPIQARLQPPHFLIAGDTSLLSANLFNRGDVDFTASAELQLAGNTLAFSSSEKSVRKDLSLSRNTETKTAWSVHAVEPGESTLTLAVKVGSEGDAVQRTLPVFEDSISRTTSINTALIRDARSASLTFELPDPIDSFRTTVHLQLAPSHAAVVLDALPYVIDQPYGSVEQTMNRFLPALISKATFTRFGMDPGAHDRRILTRELNAGATRHPHSEGFQTLDDVVAQSITHLGAAYQNPGKHGFCWWRAGKTDLWMTAYIAWGLELAKDAGINIPKDLLYNTNLALSDLLEAKNLTINDDVAWALVAASRLDWSDDEGLFSKLFDHRDSLSASGRACLLLSAKKFGTPGQRETLVRDLEKNARHDRQPGLGDTAHWGSVTDCWRACDSATESTALTLLALLENAPGHPLIEPAANWLTLNRSDAHWNNTRDTAFSLLALTRHLSTTREGDPDSEIEILINGSSFRRQKLDRASLLAGHIQLPLDPTHLKAGKNTVELRRIAGRSPVYALASVTSWVSSDNVKPSGNLASITRVFERQKTTPTINGALQITPEPQPPLGHAAIGEIVTARVTLTLDHDLEYVRIEVPRPAGCEPISPISDRDARLSRIEILGQHAIVPADVYDVPGQDESRLIYRDERDDKSVFFIDKIGAGTWEICFDLRTIHAGDYRALPAQIEAMYAPKVRAQSDSRRLRIEK